MFWRMEILGNNIAEGHPPRFSQRESSINHLLTAESKPLRCPRLEDNARTCAVFSIFPQRTQKQRTAWRRIQSAAKSSLKKALTKNQPVNFKIFYELSRAFQFNIPKNIIAFISVFPLVNFVKWNEPVCHNDSEIIRLVCSSSIDSAPHLPPFHAICVLIRIICRLVSEDASRRAPRIFSKSLLPKSRCSRQHILYAMKLRCIARQKAAETNAFVASQAQQPGMGL
jgi:hypothetical protein